MNPYLPSPETIRKYTVGIKAPAPSYHKYALRNLESGKTINGTERKVRYKKRNHGSSTSSS